MKRLRQLQTVKHREDFLTRPLRQHPFFDEDGVQQRLRPEERDELRDLEMLAEDEEPKSRWDRIIRSVGPSLRCPVCDEFVESSRSWVLAGRIAVCRSCFFQQNGNAVDVKDCFVGTGDYRWVSGDIKRLRAEKGWSQAAVARECGVSQPFISRIERSVTKLTEVVALTLREVLGPDASRRTQSFRVKVQDLLSSVESSGFSIREVCRRAHISRTQWYRMLHTERATQRFRDKIVAAMRSGTQS